jgi:hypothetical protein
LLDADTVDLDKITFQYYSDGQPTNPIADLEGKWPVFSAIKNTSTRSAVIYVRTFSSEANHIAWGDSQGYNFTAAKKLKDSVRAEGIRLGYQVNSLTETAVGNDIVDYANLVVVPTLGGVFAGGYQAWDDWVPGSSNTFFPSMTHPRLVSWNNRIGSVMGWSTRSVFHFFDRWFYGRHISSFAEWGFTHVTFHPWYGLGALDNRITSYIHIVI